MTANYRGSFTIGTIGTSQNVCDHVYHGVTKKWLDMYKL